MATEARMQLELAPKANQPQRRPVMTAAEARGSARLAGEMLGELVGWIEEAHLGIASRWFGLSGSSAKPVQVIHDVISKGVYGTIRGAARGGAVLAGAGAELRMRRRRAPGVSTTPTGGRLVSFVNGVLGDRMHEAGNGLSLGMEVRVRGHAVPPNRTALAKAFPDGTPRIAVFLHGLTENETFWHRPPGRRRWQPVSYGRMLRAEHGFTPVYVRYNSGRRVSDNGAELSELLERLVENWPAEVREIAFFGHSMGGLLARSAGHQANLAGHGWVSHVRHLFCLGAPHAGSWLAQAAHSGAEALSRLPETKALASVIEARSAGIRDMRFGPLVADHWDYEEADCLAADARGDVPWLEGVNHYFIAATLTRDSNHPVSRACGDLLVGHSSAWAEGKHAGGIRFDTERSRIYGGLTHFDLLGHPAIAEQISNWIAAASSPAQITNNCS